MANRNDFRLVHSLVLLVGASWALGAGAIPVSVVGGFTSYSGLIGTGAEITTINGVTVCPDTGCTTGSSEVTGSATIPLATPSVDFSFSFLGSPQTPNLISFTAAPAQDVLNVGDEFLLGTFTFTNGNWFPPGMDLAFSLTTVSSFAPFDGQVFSDILRLAITPNSVTNTAAENSDYFSFVGRTDLGNFNAFELSDAVANGTSNTVTVDFFGKIGSLIPTRFTNPQGGGFIGNGVVPVIVPATTVPEPTTLALLGLGLAGVALSTRRRARRS